MGDTNALKRTNEEFMVRLMAKLNRKYNKCIDALSESLSRNNIGASLPIKK